MQKAASLFFPPGPLGIPSTAENSNDRMSVAQKEWPVRGRILMARTNGTNEDPREKKPLTGGVGLVTGGSRGIGRAIAHRLALLGAFVSICGRDRAALEESARELAKIGGPPPKPTTATSKTTECPDPVVKTAYPPAPRRT